ncbi:IclR family transcriptional regulator [Aeromicrobium sp. CF4.19]|uniref:IclR family transcriptional regulator n=1 Tax=Aeromicrobium sp. CF4.19 TaxID=3373082 RepID=UPI003EE78F7F
MVTDKVTHSSGDGVSVLGKVSALLEALASTERASVAELAEVLGEPRSSVHRMVRQMAELGWVESDGPRGQWGIGLQLFRLGSSAVQKMDVRKAALPHMHQIQESTGLTSLLVVRRDLEAVCIERVEGKSVQSLVLMLGGAIPLHAGAGPMSILAWSSNEVRRAWAAHVDEVGFDARATPLRVVPTRRQVESDLDETRSRGYAVSDRNVSAGIGAIGAPVFDFRGDVVAAVSASGVAETVLDSELAVAEQVREAARRTSFDLGGQTTI